MEKGSDDVSNPYRSFADHAQ